MVINKLRDMYISASVRLACLQCTVRRSVWFSNLFLAGGAGWGASLKRPQLTEEIYSELITLAFETDWKIAAVSICVTCDIVVCTVLFVEIPIVIYKIVSSRAERWAPQT